MKIFPHLPLFLMLCVLVTWGPARYATAQQNPAELMADALKRLDVALPRQAADFADFRPETVAQLCRAVERSAADFAGYDEKQTPPAEILRITDRVLEVKDHVDRLLTRTLDIRVEFAAFVQGDQGRDALRHYLRTTAALIDLSGRMRYLLVDAIDNAAGDLADRASEREQLVDMVCRRRSSVGAMEMGVVINDPGPDAPPGVRPVSDAAKVKLLQLIATTGQTEMLAELTRLIRNPQSPAALVVSAVEAIRDVGIPQNPRPDQEADVAKPLILARELYAIVDRLDPTQLNEDVSRRRTDLLDLLRMRATKGLTEDTYHLGNFDLQPGDWLLMRNPSPYNLFTDLSPGLFTHVGVIAAESGPDGIRRMVVVDLPEKGTRMPATNIDAFVKRTLHYLVLRHPDPEVARKMGDIAASVIGNETQFDLNFRADRVTELKGQSLTGRKIHAYCAGLLLLCAQETTAPRSDFFPIPEFPAPGKTRDNLARLGITFGDDILSPTGAFFSAKLTIVGRSEPMYDATREIREAVYDRFAQRIDTATFTPSPDLFQSMRQKLAEYSRTRPALAKALANAAGVSANMDLVSAAKAGAVVETLDDIANGASEEYFKALEAIMVATPEPVRVEQVPAGPFAGGSLMGRRAMMSRNPTMMRGPFPGPGPGGAGPGGPRGRMMEMQQGREEAARAMYYQTLHPAITQQWIAEQDPRELRIELVKYYIREGCEQLDARFFGGKE